MNSIAWFILAAFAEIAGCFAFWAWLRMGKVWVWVLPGMAALAALAVFAFALTRVEAAFAGRAYAAYGGVYIVSALAWLWIVEQQRPDRWDTLGAAVCVLGSFVILFGPRTP